MLAGTPDPHMLPGRGLGHPKLGPMGARSSSEPAASLLKEAQAGPCPGAGVGRPFPRSCLEPSLSGASRPPSLRLAAASNAALWPEPGRRHFSYPAFPSPLSCARTEIYSRPQAGGAGSREGSGRR